MFVVRIAFALILALLAILTAFVQVEAIREAEEWHVIEQIGPFLTAFCLAASAFYYFCPRVSWDAELTCPNCRNRGSLRVSSLGQPRLSIMAWVLGGVIGALLYSHARKHRFHCESCSEVSDLRTTGGWLAAIWLLLLVFYAAVAIYVHGNG